MPRIITLWHLLLHSTFLISLADEYYHIAEAIIMLQILQNLGKVDRTADDIFDEHLTNFTRQQNAANRLQKEFNNYIRCIRGDDLTTETTEP